MASGYTLSEGAVRKLAGLVRGGMETTRRGASSPSAVSFDGFALPFAVRWSASEGQSGAWVVWLPSLANLVSYAGDSCTLSGVTAATSLPAGWYTVANATTAMYLVVTVADSTGAASAELSAAPGTATTGETVYNLLVATMSTNATTGAKRVKQYIVGAIALGGDGGGGGGGEYPTVEDPTIIVQSVKMTPVDSSDPHYDSSHVGSIEISRGNLEIGDGQAGTTPGEIYAENDPYLTQYIETVPLSDLVVSNALKSST